jgi:hypothetical protein
VKKGYYDNIKPTTGKHIKVTLEEDLEVKFQIYSHEEREKLCSIFAMNGYKVYQTKLPLNESSRNQKPYIIVETKKVIDDEHRRNDQKRR